MPYQLSDILSEVNDVFPDHFVEHQIEGDRPQLQPFDALAAFLVQEIEELYSAESDDEHNLMRIISGLERATYNLEAVVKRLRRLQESKT